MTNYGSPSICGMTLNINNNKCSGYLKWTDAKKLCEATGSRLCTLVEIVNNEPKNTGCNYDRIRTWSSTACPNNGFMTTTTEQGMDFDPALPEECTAMDDDLVVARCCADDDSCIE